MKTYKIEIEEILQKVYEVEANSLDEAIDIVEEKYCNQEYVLGWDALQETNIRQFPYEESRDGHMKKEQSKGEEPYER